MRVLLLASTRRTSLVAHMVNNLPAVQEAWVQTLGREDPLEKEMETTPDRVVWSPVEPCPVDARFLPVSHSAPLFLYLLPVENGHLPLRVWEKLYQTVHMHCINFTTL